MSKTAELMAAGDRHVRRQDWPAARAAFEAVLASGEHAGALIHLSYLASKQQAHAAAYGYAMRAYACMPKKPENALRLLPRLRHFNELAAVHDYVGRSPWLAGLGVHEQHLVGAHLSGAGDHAAALGYFDRALAIAPSAELFLARGQMLMFLGRFDESADALARSVELSPDLSSAWWALVQVRKQTLERNDAAPLAARLAAPHLAPAARIHYGFALHRVLDAVGDHAGAASALATACAVKRREQPYDPIRTAALFDRIRAVDAALPPPLPRPRAPEAFTPVFVVGMFRSGTTLLEQLLAANPVVRNAGELRDFSAALSVAVDHHCREIVDEALVDGLARVDLAAVGADYRRRVQSLLDGGTHLTDKMPPNFLQVGAILRALPDARILHMVRDPVETCFSNLRESFTGAAPYSNDQVELADYYLKYERLMTYWHAAYPGRILDVRYDALTTKTAEVMREVAGFCGLDFTEAMTDPLASKRSVATASLVQVRGPVVARKVAKWEPYRAFLQPLIRRLEAGGVAVG